MRDVERFDFLVVGAGIAGASVAAELSKHASVGLVEMEAQPGYHTTGRSAAMFAPSYGPAPIRALTRASAEFFQSPPEGFTQSQLLTPLPAMMMARKDQLGLLQEFIDEVSPNATLQRLSAQEIETALPLVRKGYATAAVVDHGTYSIDVAALHQGYLRQLKAQGGALMCSTEISALTSKNGPWQAQTNAGTLEAPVVINAAGAWADEIGRMAGAESIGLIPKRRTALIVDGLDGRDASGWPMVIDIAEEFYLKADAGKLLISPANEDQMPACDAQPDELDIAICIDRIERAFDLRITRIDNKWAGLRSFVDDKCPVAGFSGQAEGFFWLAGQGGYGIQSCPALARHAAAVVLGTAVPSDVLDAGFAPETVLPDRPSLRN